jgi:hypothetical protein
MGMPPVQIRADHIFIIEATGEGVVITCARCHRANVPLGQCRLFGLLLKRSDSPFAPLPIEPNVVWPSAHVKQVFNDLVNNGFHNYQDQNGIYRIDAHDVLVQPSLTYPAQSVGFQSDRDDCPS